MTAADPKRWGCQFCGLGAVQEDKPVPGACREREGAAHSWMSATILESDPDVLAELKRKIEAREELIAQEVGAVLGEKLRAGDVDMAQALVARLMVEGDGWQTALIQAGKAAASSAAERTILGLGCVACGLRNVTGYAPPGLPPGGGCGARSGAGHLWRWHWAEGECEANRERWSQSLETMISVLGASWRADAAADAMKGGVPYLDAIERAKVLPEPAAVVEAPPAEPSSSIAQPVDESSSTPAAAEAPAKRPRGRPRKDGSAPVVAAPTAPRPSPREPVLAPGGVLTRAEDVRGEGYDPDELWAARELVRAIDDLLDRVVELQGDMSGERGGHVFGEFTDELHRRRGKVGRRVRELERTERETREKRLKGAAE